MSVISRTVTADEKACRICLRFNGWHTTCWIDIKDFGKNCSNFKRNHSIKTVVNFVEDKDE